jgi:DNA replication protein DnaC
MNTEICPKHNEVMVIPTKVIIGTLIDAAFLKPYCPTCVAEAKKQQDVEERQQDIDRHAQRRLLAEATKYRHLQIGRRFESATFDGFIATSREQRLVKETCQRYATTFPDRLREGDSLILSGNPGTGKNHLAAAIAKAVVDQGHVVVHTTASRLLREIKETWGGRGDKTEREVIASFVKPDLLIIDEVGMMFGSTAEQILFMEVINSRYADMRPTILISMDQIEDLAKSVGAQIIDRFCEGKSSILKFTWSSHRVTGRSIHAV